MAALDGRDARKRFSHSRLDQLFQMQLTADKGAKYTKYLHLFNAYQPPDRACSGVESVHYAIELAIL
jgi:hypothetical protein